MKTGDTYMCEDETNSFSVRKKIVYFIFVLNIVQDCFCLVNLVLLVFFML